MLLSYHTEYLNTSMLVTGEAETGGSKLLAQPEQFEQLSETLSQKEEEV